MMVFALIALALNFLGNLRGSYGHPLFQNCSSAYQPVAQLPGDVTIVLILPFRDGSGCQVENKLAIQQLMATELVVQKLNEMHYMGSKQLGFLAYNACNQEDVSKLTMFAVVDSQLHLCHNPGTLMAIVGPDNLKYGEEMRSVTEASKVMQVHMNGWEESAVFTSKLGYISNFFRGALNFLRSLNVNFVHVVYNDDLVSNKTIDNLKKLFGDMGICMEPVNIAFTSDFRESLERRLTKEVNVVIAIFKPHFIKFLEDAIFAIQSSRDNVHFIIGPDVGGFDRDIVGMEQVYMFQDNVEPSGTFLEFLLSQRKDKYSTLNNFDSGVLIKQDSIVETTIKSIFLLTSTWRDAQRELCLNDEEYICEALRKLDIESWKQRYYQGNFRFDLEIPEYKGQRITSSSLASSEFIITDGASNQIGSVRNGKFVRTRSTGLPQLHCAGCCGEDTPRDSSSSQNDPDDEESPEDTTSGPDTTFMDFLGKFTGPLGAIGLVVAVCLISFIILITCGICVCRQMS